MGRRRKATPETAAVTVGTGTKARCSPELAAKLAGRQAPATAKKAPAKKAAAPAKAAPADDGGE